jgi:hypothetical protein
VLICDIKVDDGSPSAVEDREISGSDLAFRSPCPELLVNLKSGGDYEIAAWIFFFFLFKIRAEKNVVGVGRC